MLNFLKQTRKFVNTKEPICIVLGNESCDLDSAVCAVSMAYYYQKNRNSCLNTPKAYNYLPVLNIPKRDYPLKTEVKYIFQENNISEEWLTFKDELNEDFLKDSAFVLVDHHVSPWLKNCIAIYDHRPKDAAAIISDKCDLHLNLVGSCATLVAEKFVNAKMLDASEKEILNLLRSTIVLDTVNFSESAARATPKDLEICLALEEVLEKFNCLQNRETLFETLVKARADVGSLTASQLLRKDLKILTSNKNGGNINIAIPGFPLLVQHFISKSGAEDAVKEFAQEFNCSVVLLMGMFVQPEDNSVHRDFGLINISDSTMCESIKKRLLSLDEPNLCVELYNNCNFMDGSFYKQQNIKITRKHVLPIVKNILDQ
ncbi:exopolyphosphatase PRUNE1 [Lucilia sericata]|uniref:exopolyphosphatase PRUNE1 n=1 Tax=Lucilia sericata TaxID=13632 RepID=UPI0018A8790A|nr:exopolyphosphatase PRUNE1 [Lucilia sericata]